MIKIKTKIKSIFKKSNIKRYLHSALCLLLCVLTVVCFGGVLAPVQANAVAGVDYAIYFIVAFLICCGMTFASTSAATHAAQHFYAQAPPSVQEIIDYQAEQLQKDSALSSGVLAVLKSQWKALIDEFVRQFPQYCNIDLDYSSAVKNQLTEDTLFKSLVAGTTVSISIPWTLDTNIFIQTSANTTLSIYGIDTLRKVVGSDLYNQISNYNSNFKNMNNTHFAVFNVPALDFTVILIIGFNSSDSSVISKLAYFNSNSDVYINGFPVSGIGTYSIALYKNEICNYTFDSVSRSYTFTAPTYGNIVSRWIADDVISSNDNLINCDDLCLPINKISQLLLGEDVFDVGIDSAHIPGIDSFPSTTGDITDVSTYPDSIGINVPRDLSDTIGKSAEDIRDVDLDNTDTKDDTKDDTVSDAKDISDVLDDKIPAIREINDIITGFNNSHAKGFYFEFVFYHKKYVIDCAFYEPYRENVRGALSVLFIVMTFLACFKLFRSCIGISFSGGEGDNDNDQ